MLIECSEVEKAKGSLPSQIIEAHKLLGERYVECATRHHILINAVKERGE